MDGRTFVRSVLPALLGLGLAVLLTVCRSVADLAPASLPPTSQTTTTTGAHP